MNPIYLPLKSPSHWGCRQQGSLRNNRAKFCGAAVTNVRLAYSNNRGYGSVQGDNSVLPSVDITPKHTVADLQGILSNVALSAPGTEHWSSDTHREFSCQQKALAKDLLLVGALLVKGVS